MADEEQISSDDQDEELTDFHISVPRRSYKTIPDSYSYRLTHDISLDNFQSEDIFEDGEIYLNLQEKCGCGQEDSGTTSICERNHSNSSGGRLLKESMIQLELSDTNVLSECCLTSTKECLDNGHDVDDAATMLLSIVEAETGQRNNQEIIKTDDSDNSRKGQRQKRKTKRKGRKLPQMPTAKPGNLQTELLQADRTTVNSNSSALSSTPSPDNNVSLSSVPPSPSDNSTLPNTPVEPYALQRPNRLEFNTTSQQYTPFLTNTNMLLQEDSSPEERQMRRLRQKIESAAKSREESNNTEDEEKPCFQPATLVINGEVKQQTHIAAYRFLPRHSDELAFEVNDPVFVECQCDDLWHEGINLKTGEEGCFPGRYVRDFTADTESIPGFRGRKVHINRYMVKFLGSVEVAFHKGNDVLCRAMQKVVTTRRLTMELHPPTCCLLEISDIGVKMVDQTKPPKSKEKKDSVLRKVEKLLGSKQNKGHNYFFSLKNVSFCGYHPSSNRYFAFITKHPTDKRYACHVFIMEDGLSAKPVAEAMGAAFRRFYSEFLDFTNPTEDIYME